MNRLMLSSSLNRSLYSSSFARNGPRRMASTSSGLSSVDPAKYATALGWGVVGFVVYEIYCWAGTTKAKRERESLADRKAKETPACGSF
mmetsp:Transcript_32358/g.44455  ORF Transcript_32358/g.44455 Transcript_32358/m.44455 type:complete len:89 (+) Transcript_32358:44-310(+)